MTSVSINRVIRGRYRLISQLAAGGMGVTYRAWDLRAGGPVVLKMPRRPKDDPDGREFARLAARFAREVEVMRALGHDHIVPIVDHGDDDGTPFVAMRFLSGGALSDHRKKPPSGDWQPIPASQLHTWLPSIAEALDFIHSKGVVHRDVKPANVFLDGFTNAFLGDFGIAKIVGDDAGLERGQTLTATHLAIGTPEYMAPELLSPQAVADGRADQYALAISVYELISGCRPFTGKTAHIVIEHASHPVPPLDRKALGLPSSLTAALERALAKKPAERFGSCREFTRALLADVQMQPYEPGVVRLLCPGCRKVLRVPQAAGGRQGNCPSCKQSMEIAEDFSALWLRSEAALVSEQSIAPSTIPLLGTVDTEPTAPETPTAPATPDLVHTGRDRNRVAFAAFIVSALLAAGLGAGMTHWWWFTHHNHVLRSTDAGRAQERAMHAAELLAAAQDRVTAVESIEAEWKKKLSDAEQAFEDDLADQRAAIRESEKVRLETIETQSSEEERLSSSEAVADAVTPQALDIESPPRLTNSVGIELKRIASDRLMNTAARRFFTTGDLYLSALYLGAYEVTNAQWRRVMGSSANNSDEDDRPVVNVSWNDAHEFCGRLSAMPAEIEARRMYDLPRAADWAQACRAGTRTVYSFGDDDSQLGDYAWFSGNSGGELNPVGKKLPNPLGLYDMHGNVSEWCFDEVIKGRRRQHGGGPQRVACGGSKIDDAKNCTSTRQYSAEPHRRSSSLGFRIAMVQAYKPMTNSKVAPSPTPPAVDVKSEASGVGFKEVSDKFEARSTRIDTKDNEFWLASLVSTDASEERRGGRIWLVNFEGDKEEAEQALVVMRHYGINERVTLSGQGSQEKFVYWLCDGRAPVGPCPGVRDIRTQVIGHDFEIKLMQVVGGRKWCSVNYTYGDGRGSGTVAVGGSEFCKRVLEALKFHNFTCLCSLGNRNAHFTYMHR